MRTNTSTASWHQKEFRRNFFENYASVHEFDALVPEKWYSEIPNLLLSKVLYLSLYSKLLFVFHMEEEDEIVGSTPPPLSFIPPTSPFFLFPYPRL